MFRGGPFSLRLGSPGGTPPWRRPAGAVARRTRASASSSSSPAGSASVKV